MMARIGKVLLFVLPALGLLMAGFFLIGSDDAPPPSLRGLGQAATTVSLDPPEDLNFAGEPVPMRDFEVRERLETELIRNIYMHSSTIIGIKRAARWRPEMIAILSKEGIPLDFFYLCVAESHLSNATSPAGAKGFWQFMEGTAKLYDLEVNGQVDERYDPIKSTYAACKYFKDAYKVFGNWTLVAASYNMGIGGISGQLKKQRVDSYYDLYLNRETAAYVFRVLAFKTILETPEQYGYILRPNQLYTPLRYKTVTVDTSIHDMVEFANAHGTTYKMLKLMNPWLLGDSLIIPKGEGKKSYAIQIPLGSKDDAGMGELNPKRGRRDSIVDSSAPASKAPTGDSARADSGGIQKGKK